MSIIEKDGYTLVKRKDGKIVWGSWDDGSDVVKDKNGFYVMQWDVENNKEYKKYLPKSWKPIKETIKTLTRVERKRMMNKSINGRKQSRKNKRHRKRITEKNKK